MNTQDIKIELGPVQETLMMPLWDRARESEKNNPIVYDIHAKKIVERVDYDFSRFEDGPVADHQGVWAIRAYNFDSIIEEYPMLSKIPARNDFSRKDNLIIKIVGFFRLYNMIHVQL